MTAATDLTSTVFQLSRALFPHIGIVLYTFGFHLDDWFYMFSLSRILLFATAHWYAICRHANKYSRGEKSSGSFIVGKQTPQI